MAIGDDFSVATNGDIRYTGTTTNYTVIAFHRWLGDLMDDALWTGLVVLRIIVLVGRRLRESNPIAAVTASPGGVKSRTGTSLMGSLQHPR